MKRLKDILPLSLYEYLLNSYNKLFNDFTTKTYSQEGEDLILRKVFGKRNKGFYIDIGAHHPKRFSNTYFFYKNGWNGINIEARPGSKILFDKTRPRDINLEFAISSESKELTYYMFNEPALNGFSTQNAANLKDHKEYKIIREIKLNTQRLDSVLARHVIPTQNIDFMSIDVEGLDYDVIISNNWTLYKPKIILIEDPEFDFKNGSKICVFLESYNYKMIARTFNTSFFMLL
jgi:FkbM family methyltransferase